GNERGCLKIIGNPVDPSLVGEYNLIGQVKAYAAQAGALSPLDETVNLGKFSILSPVSIPKNSEAAIASLQVYPNPIQQNSTLLFTAAQKSIYNLNIYNVLGSKVVSQTINVNKGENKFPLNFS